MTPVITLQSVNKRFPGVWAVRNFSFELFDGKVHALVGANGSGKSTVVKIIAGAHSADSGDFLIRGKPAHFKTTGDAKSQGIVTVFQERQIFPDLSAAENIFLGNLEANKFKITNWRASIAKAQELVNSFGLDFDCSTPMSHFGVGVQQMVEIIRGMILQPDVLILDEPTASLSRGETEKLFGFIRTLRSRDVAILFIAHNLDEVLEISDEITVMRDGANVDYIDTVADITKPDLIGKMLGSEIDMAAYTPEKSLRQTQTPSLRIKSLPVDSWGTDVSFDVRKGEILSLAGLIGSGTAEIARRVGGAIPTAGGHLFKENIPITLPSRKAALQKKIGYLPPDRKKTGLFMNLDNNQNIIASILDSVSNRSIYRPSKAKTKTVQMIKESKITPPDPDFPTVKLSGGNQQKVLLSRVLATGPEVIILENPTVGVDVNAQFSIHRLIRRKVQEDGISVLLVSSDYHELAVLSDRILIVREGNIITELGRGHFNEGTILNLVGAENE